MMMPNFGKYQYSPNVEAGKLLNQNMPIDNTKSLWWAGEAYASKAQFRVR